LRRVSTHTTGMGSDRDNPGDPPKVAAASYGRDEVDPRYN